MTRAPARTIGTIGAIVAVVGGLAGLVAVLLGIGGDVAVVRSDVARHEAMIASQAQTVHALELGTAVLPTRLEDLTRRLDDLTRRIERLDVATPRSTP